MLYMSKSIIYINGYCLSAVHLSGVQRFAYETLKALDSLSIDNPQFQFIIVLPAWLQPQNHLTQFNNISYLYYGKFKQQYLWEQCNLAYITRGHFLINLCNFAPIFKTQQLTVIHDLLVFAYPDSYSKKFVWLCKFMFQRIMKYSNYIATVSHFSQHEINLRYKDLKNNILLLQNSANNFNNIIPVNIKSIKFDKYFLVVFSQQDSTYKNVQRFFQAVQFLPPTINIICVGQVHVESYTTAPNVQSLGFVTDAELKFLYQHTQAFIFPSLYEGFGIPLLEAMECGCPIIASDIPVVHEVCDDAAIYFNPLSVDDMVNAIKHFQHLDSNIIKTMIYKGRIRANKFTWQHNAHVILSLLENRHLC